MTIIEAIIALLVSAILFFWLGYNATFNTKRTISKNMSFAGYNKDSEKYKKSMSDSSLLRAKISGVVMMILAILFFIGFIVRTLQLLGLN